MKDTDLAWAAGLIDGEGSLSIRIHRNVNGRFSPNYILALRVAMCCEVTVRKIHDMFNCGFVGVSYRASEARRVNTAWVWCSSTRQAETILRLIRPYMVTKAREADVALAFCELPTARGGQHQHVPPELTAKRHALYLQLKALKSRSRFYDDPTGHGHRETRHVLPHHLS